MGSGTPDHRWRFFRAGGVDQARLDTGADIRALADLDLKTWVALACPVKGLEFDERTMALLDGDGDQRIRAPEVIEAARWATGVLKDPDLLVKGGDTLRLAAIDESTPEGARLLASARRILAGAGKADADAIALADAVEAAAVLAKATLNGDGIVPPAAVADAFLKAVATDAVASMGGTADASGEPGITKDSLAAFFDELAAYEAWQAKATADSAAVLALGDGTAAAADAVMAVKAKVDDYFMRCRLASFDARALGAMNREEGDWKALAAKDLVPGSAEIAAFPLARIEPDRALPLSAGLNPAWVDVMATLRDKAVEPLLGKGKAALTAADWASLNAKLAAYEAWRGARAGGKVEALGAARVREILASDARAGLQALLDADAAVEPEMKAIVDVERLVRYVRDLHKLLNNYVSFADFYARRKAVFQAGTLFIDGRACDLCLQVHDPAKHAALAGLAKMYLLYCDCSRPSGEKMQIVAAMTNGDSDNLMVGRNGVFYDRKGRDWDATVTRIIENPISLRQAFWSPYKKFLRMVEEMVAKRAAAADAAADAKMAGAAQATAHADETKPPAAPKKIDVGTVAAIGVAVGGLTAALGALLGAFFGLGIWMPVGLVGLILLISGPSMLIAWLKLRKRNIGPILDASGWAVNALARINTPFGAALTGVGRLPDGAERSLDDPFAEKKSRWPRVLLVLAILGAVAYGVCRLGLVDDQCSYCRRLNAPAAVPAPAADPAAVPAAAPSPAPAAK